MLALQPLEGASVHPLRPSAGEVEDTGFPAQPLPDRLRPPRRAIIVGFSLAVIDQSVAVPTGEDTDATDCCRSRYSASFSQNNPRQICRILPPLLPRLVSLDNYANIPCVLAMAAIDPCSHRHHTNERPQRSPPRYVRRPLHPDTGHPPSGDRRTVHEAERTGHSGRIRDCFTLDCRHS
jgi:hypothetical protein